MALSSQGKKDLKKELDTRNNLESSQREWEAIQNRSECRNIVKLQQQQQRKEQETADQEQNTREGEAYQDRILKQEESLSREKERQMLRENRDELKELETELRDAHKESDLRVQMAENEDKRRQEGFWSVKSNTTLEGARAKKSEHNIHLKQQALDEKHEHRKELQDQMRHNENLMSCKYEDFLREKILIDQVVERIHQEDQRDFQEKWLQMQKTKEEIMAFKEAHEVWKEKQREQIEEENRKIQEYMFSEHSDDQANAVKKQEAQLRKHTIAKRLDEEREVLEQQRIEYKDIERHFHKRINMNSGLYNQAKECEEIKKQVAKEESHHREMVQRNPDEGLKLEFMSKDKCRIRTVQLRKDLEDLVLEKRRHQAGNLKLLLKMNESELQELAERKRKIEDERIRMLREHAVRHIGYMPSGIFMEEDLLEV